MTSRSPVVAAIESTARSWRSEAEKRRAISKADPIADTLDYCAGEIAARLRSIANEIEYETVDERAGREKVTPQTIRAWIRSGQLLAHDGPKGYRIPRSAERIRRAG